MAHGGWTRRGYHPHFDAPGEVQHVVFRLADYLPAKVLAGIETFASSERLSIADASLDRGYGSRLLVDCRAASIVQESLLHFHDQRYRLLAWCVMSTHVHVLMEVVEAATLAGVVHGWKSFTAHAINRVLGRRGAVWARDYFDRAMRSEDQANAAAVYIEYNPVAAGLCAEPSDWPFSSASKDAGETSADQDE